MNLFGFIKNLRAFINYRNMWQYVKPVWGRAVLSILVTIPIGLLDAVMVMAVKPYMELAKIESSTVFTWYIPVGIVIFTIVQGFFKYLSAYLSTWVGNKITNALKFDLFQKLLTFSPAFFTSQNSGDVLFQFNNMADNASSGLIKNMSTFVQKFFSSVSLVGVLFYNSWQLASIAVLVFICAFLPAMKIRKRIEKVMQKKILIDASIITEYNEVFAGHKTIISYNLFQYEMNKFLDILQKAFRSQIKMVQHTQWLSPVMHIIISVGVAISFALGAHLILTEIISVADFISFVTAMLLLYTPLKTIGNDIHDLQFSFVCIESVFNLFKRVPDILQKEDAVEIDDTISSIAFHDVCFEYLPDTPVLKKINLEIRSGETIAFVGNSGGGKTSLVSLLPRFYDVTSGKITINETDIRNYSLQSLRKNIAVVFQDNFLFSGTIRENIAIGKENATDEQIMQAVQMAYLDEFIASLKDGIYTQIGERGVLLSGGQKQRVAIARAFLKDAPIIVLDEATSALDNKAEAVVQKAIDNLMDKKTVLVIAHRLSTIKNATKIVVVSEGNIAEIGSHEELMQIENGIYKKLYEMQFKKNKLVEV